MDMKGKTALVTGGTSGIGKATAISFGREGANVIIVSRNEEKGKTVEKELKQMGINAVWLQADVAKVDEAREMIRKAKDIYGRIDYAFNNAKTGGRADMVDKIDEAEWEKTMAGVLSSVFYCMKYELQVMLEQGGGAIVNNASVDGLRGFPWDPAYSAAKHGVIGLTKSAALQYARNNIRINAVCPGWIWTPPIEARLARNPESEKEMMMHQPIGRFGRPEEVAAAVVWLCSDKASFMLGAALTVDGGYTAV
ncbi:MAG TPA: glucose 1-dehydrogenase [Firmicutes bacterium]|nr:glucose 1-dehydrogenase [Bacillota bacterium]